MPKKKQDTEQQQEEEEPEEAFITLPHAAVKRVIEAALPSGMKVTKATGDTINACCTVLIRTLTSEANRQCVKSGKQFISADHVEEALEMVFPEAVEELAPPKKKTGRGERGSRVASEAPAKKKRRKKLTKEEEAELAEEQDAMFRNLMMPSGGGGGASI